MFTEVRNVFGFMSPKIYLHVQSGTCAAGCPWPLNCTDSFKVEQVYHHLGQCSHLLLIYFFKMSCCVMMGLSFSNPIMPFYMCFPHVIFFQQISHLDFKMIILTVNPMIKCISILLWQLMCDISVHSSVHIVLKV